MKLKRIRVIFYQFGILCGIRVLLAEVARRIFEPWLIPSYSQTGEDRLILAMLGGLERGFYVDVGCNRPHYWSNTFALYRKGWAGLCIDALNELVDQHKKLRKRDSSVCAVISDKERLTEFTEFENSCVSSMSPAHVEEWRSQSRIKRVRQVKTVSLSSVLKVCNAPQSFELLSIDVEGHDFEVLCSLDFGTYRPKLIVIEMHGFNLLAPADSKIYNYLVENHYELVCFALMNGYFRCCT